MLETIPDGRLFGLDGQTLISIGIQLFNACFLAAALSYILYRPVSNFIRKRSDRIREQLSRAEEDMAKAGELKACYEKNLEGIELERAEILESARRLASEKSKSMLDEAQKEAIAVRARATADIQKERKRVNEEMRLYIIELSSIMAGKFMANAIDGDTQDRLFAEATAELEKAVWRN